MKISKFPKVPESFLEAYREAMNLLRDVDEMEWADFDRLPPVDRNTVRKAILLLNVKERERLLKEYAAEVEEKERKTELLEEKEKKRIAAADKGRKANLDIKNRLMDTVEEKWNLWLKNPRLYASVEDFDEKVGELVRKNERTMRRYRQKRGLRKEVKRTAHTT